MNRVQQQKYEIFKLEIEHGKDKKKKEKEEGMKFYILNAIL